MGVEFKKVSPEEAEKLRKALRSNAEVGTPLTMDPKDTSFQLDERQLEEELINTIKSVPCHYGHKQIILEIGDSLDVVLPSAQTINIEVTQDTADVVCGEFTLWGEEKSGDAWETRWPETIKQGLEDQRYDKVP